MLKPFTMTCLLLAVLTSTAIAQEKVPSGEAKLSPDTVKKIATQDQITIELFRKIQADKQFAEQIVLVDCRSDGETKVSVIPGAITKKEYESDPKKYAGRTAVCYCLSGGRSGKFVKQLKQMNVPAVDLKGSIKGWCEAELPLATLDGKPTNKVNVYGQPVPAKYESVE